MPQLAMGADRLGLTDTVMSFLVARFGITLSPAPEFRLPWGGKICSLAAWHSFPG